MDLSIVIVSYNTQELLRKCLESIIDCLEKSKIKGEIIIVDNGSTDGSARTVKKEFPKVKLIENKENLGFARANNQALRQVRGEYILLLNSDTEVKPGALESLLEFAEKHPEAGIVGAKLLNPDGSIQPSVYHFPTVWRAIKEYWLGKEGEYEKYIPDGAVAVGVEAVTGAAMLVARKVIEKVGQLDNRYFMYFEDLDFCRRVKQKGFQIFYLPSAEIVHHHGASGKTIVGQTRQWLIKSSKIYNGLAKYYFLTLVIWLGVEMARA